MHSKTPLITRLKKIGTTIEQRDVDLSAFVEACCAAGVPYDVWHIIYNEKKKALILFAPDGTQYKPIPAEGDEFNVYTGFALAVFENHMGLTYQDINRLFGMFTERTEKHDPALLFICKFVAEATGITEKDLMARLDSAKADRSGKHFLISVPLCLVTADEIEDETPCGRCCEPEDPIACLLAAILSA